MSEEIATQSKSEPLPPWPPILSAIHVDELTNLATDYCMSHGLVYRPPASPPAQPYPPTSSTIHAPFTLFPSPLPRPLFELAKKLQPLYNTLYARIAVDVPWLDSIMSVVAKVDSFQGELWKIWKLVREEGSLQPLQLGMWRSDYLMHALPDGTFTLRQVEFNTISSSFGALAQRVSEMHHYLQASTNYFGGSSYLKRSNMPVNHALHGLVAGLAQAHTAYGLPGAYVVMVVQPHERNAFDQAWLEYELLEKHGIHLQRATLTDLATNGQLSDNNALLLSTPLYEKPLEVSVVYYRAGYTPNDYNGEREWGARLLVERSKAIKCPTVAAQLAGAKKIQQALMEEGILEKFLLDPARGPEEFSKADLALLRASFAPMYALSSATLQETVDNSAHLVLKPQREGGGNNVYRASIPPFLAKLPEAERDAWVVMELIEPPSLRNILVKAGSSHEGGKEGEVISELGIFGVCLYGREGDGVTSIKANNEVGYLVRTKGRESDEGGVAVGYSCLDSLVLVD